ncbi:hypothetical protein C4D60_Mb09t26920 [Musa balbisiana]|uniref:Uncharacterized protein n=1 Tax=Musa balbisiana TaxID=52838 RepID=A0A4S8IJG6_MUSBA|nr:hypothetical protein C4D60_Mb09t26920 [Musa balbisiana]
MQVISERPMRSELEKQGVDVYQVEVTGELQPQTAVGMGNDNINPLSYKIWQLYYVVVNSIVDLGWGVEVKLGSLLRLVVDRHVRGTPRAPGVHHGDEHVEEADRAPGDRHSRGQRLGAAAVLAPVGRHGGGGGYRPGGRRRGAVGEAGRRGPLFAAGALEGGLHLL